MRGIAIYASILFVVLTSVTAISCGIYQYSDNNYSEEIITEVKPKGITERNWRLSKINQVSQSLTDQVILSIRTDGYFDFSADCNSHIGIYETDGKAIQFEYKYGSSRGCPNSTGISKVLIIALEEVNNYMIEKNILYLKRDSDILASFVKN
jgi:heat shock protein HslJ